MTKTRRLLVCSKPGIYFDLILIFMDLNERFFNRSINASVNWGRTRKINQKNSIRLGSYHDTHKSITIHPALDQPIVPLICLERIMFHEMLHQYFPCKKGLNGRRLVHYREFYDFEKKYPYLTEADRWLKINLKKLLIY
jgi:hypothetical protein